MPNKIAVFLADSDEVNKITLIRLINHLSPKKYSMVVYTRHRIVEIPKSVVQKKIDFSTITKFWVEKNLSQKKYMLLFVSHASLSNLTLKMKLVFFRKKSFRFANFSGEYYSLKDLKNIVLQNVSLLLSTDKHIVDADTVFTIERQQKLVIRLLFLIPSLIIILPSLLEMFIFLKKQ